AFAAYLAGYGGVLRSIQRFNTNDYWELCRHEAGLPWETTLYVPKILAAAIIGHNLAAFGFKDVAPDPPWAYDKVQAGPRGCGRTWSSRSTPSCCGGGRRPIARPVRCVCRRAPRRSTPRPSREPG